MNALDTQSDKEDESLQERFDEDYLKSWLEPSRQRTHLSV